MKVGFATFEDFYNRAPNSVGSTMIRVSWLLKYWKDAEVYKVGRHYDVMVFQKVYWDDMAEKFPGLKIMDLCDPDWIEGKPVMNYLHKMDVVTTSTDELADYIRKFVDIPVYTVPDRVDLEQYEMKKTSWGEGPIKSAVWFGYSGNFRYVVPALEELAKHNIKLTTISDQPPHMPRIYTHTAIENILYSQDTITDILPNYDIALLPKTTGIDLRGKYKSNNKTVQCQALGLPVVRDLEDFKRLMNPDERKKEAQTKRKEVEDKYDVKMSIKQMKDIITAHMRK